MPLVINDRPDVAHAVGADGVHVGQGDLRPRPPARSSGQTPSSASPSRGPDQLADVPWGRRGPSRRRPGRVEGREGRCGRADGLRRASRLRAAGEAARRRHRRHDRRCRADVIAAGAAGVAVVAAIAGAEDGGPEAGRAFARPSTTSAGCWPEPRHDRHRAHGRRLGFGRRRRESRRSQDLLGARRLRCVRDHGAHGAEHAGRPGHPRRAAGVRRAADALGPVRPRRQAIKIGMLATAEIIAAIADVWRRIGISRSCSTP